MSEHAFQGSFKLYGEGGLDTIFTVRADSQQELVNEVQGLQYFLKDLGYAVTPSASARKTWRIGGYVVGEGNAFGGGTQQVLYLYGQGDLEWRVATIYPESFDKIPASLGFNPNGNYKLWPGSPPTKADAIRRGVFNEVTGNIVVVLVPMLDREGNPVMNTNEKTGEQNIRWKFSHFVSGPADFARAEQKEPINPPNNHDRSSYTEKDDIPF